mmetsp:Transcript_7570/g.11241  ORF Transcript_7570/g.11241 Transcript_7570/m.11241 type:complete len:202 (-) Transcript_7570:2115-2720(-)
MKNLILIFALIACCILYVQGLTVKVEPREEQCFYEKTEESDTRVMLEYSVASGGFLDIDVTIHSDSGALIYNAERETEGRHSFIAERVGTYKFCFSNKIVTLTPKIVSFEIHLGDILDPHLQKIAHQDPLEKSIARLSEGLHQIQKQQQHLRMRERDHRDLTESANSSMLWWSLLEMGAFVGIAVWQVYYLRRFFEKKVKA